MCDCITCQSFRWNTGMSFDAWCAEGHEMTFTAPAQAPDGCMANSGWTRKDCEDYNQRTGRPVAKARPKNTLFQE